MLEVININEVEKGDILLIQGMQDEHQINVITVDEVTEDGLIIPLEMGGVDYCPEDMDEIIRIGTKKDHAIIVMLTQNIHLALSDKWLERVNEWQKK